MKGPDIEETVPDLVPQARIESAHDHEQLIQNFEDDLGGGGNLGYLDFEPHTLL